MTRYARHPTGPRPNRARRQTSLGRLATLLLLLRPVLLVVAVGAIAGYLLRSSLIGAGVAGALLGLILWWREIYRPGREPQQ
jgi:hypothetical protein